MVRTRTDLITAAMAIAATAGASWALTTLADAPTTQRAVHLAAVSTVLTSAKPCRPGLVWRDRFDGDAVCVTPAERKKVHDDNPDRQPGGGAYGPYTCKQGFVWRDSFDGDYACVTPQEREEERREAGRG
jgi:hypothetical protein